MPVKIEANAEPIPGYRLIERLGGGGFGEVWKAEAPGGLRKAIKFVFGDLHAKDEADGARATQELKALSRVKSVHHPYILSLERYDIIDGQLIIVMELADRTLWDRFRECRNQGLPGIPREELLQYMQETAEALDLMNVQFQLQHLDIKPQNLFLVFNHIKIADFGLVKDLGNMAAATVTGGVTPVYAAPETFDGWLSRFSDQYSLAIVYQELLTGQRPFVGATMRQLVMQHLQGEPDLSALPAGDKPTIQRALAKNPDERFPTCVEFVKALVAAVSKQPSDVPATPSAVVSPAPPLVDTPQGAPGEQLPEDLVVTRNQRGRQGQRQASPLAVPPRPVGEHRPANHVHTNAAPASQRTPAQPVPHGHASPEPANSSGCGGIVQPALVVGLGNLGLQTLLALRRTLCAEFGHADAVPHIRLLGIDTDGQALKSAGQGEQRAALRAHEVLLARLHRPSHYLTQRDRDGVMATDGWLNAKLLYRLPKHETGAGVRALGRLAFVDNYRIIAKRLDAELQACSAQDTLREQVQQSDRGVRSQVPRVYLISGLAGGTGSGMFLDAAYTLRALLRKQGHERAEIVGLFYLPSADGEGIRSTALAQTYAALTELHHYVTAQSSFRAKYPDAEANGSARSITETGSPFTRCYFLSLPALSSATSGPEEAPTPVALAGQFLFREIATTMGKALDEARRNGLADPRLHAATPGYQTFGLHRIFWPRKPLLEQAARRLCRRLVDHWLSKDARPVADTIHAWAQQQWDAAGLRPETLIERHQELCEQQLQKAPERLLQEVINPLVPLLTPPANGSADAGAAPFNAAPVVAALVSLDKLLGIPEEARDAATAPVAGAIEDALAEVSAAIADAGDRQLTELIVRLIEEPAFRLAGAEEGLRQFSRLAEHVLQSQESLTNELRARAASLYQRIQGLLETRPQQKLTPTTPLWKLGFAKKDSAASTNFAADLLELLRIYSKTRYQALILGHIQRLFVSLRGHLSDQIREVGFLRQRLRELAELVEHKSDANPAMRTACEKLLLPPDCNHLDDAARRLDEQITPDDLRSLDTSLQEVIRRQYGALLNVCMGPANLVRNLAPVMVQEAQSLLAPRFQAANVAELWLQDKKDDNAISQGLAEAYDRARLELGKTPLTQQLAVASFPSVGAGEKLQRHAEKVLADATIVADERGDEIIIYRESGPIALQALDQYNAVAQEAYRQCNAADPSLLHTRTDVPAWIA
jgi:serine/threonine protein kinase